MEREYNELILPISKLKIKVKKWITGGESLSLEEELMNEMKLTPVGKKYNLEPISGAFALKRQKKAVEIVVETLGDSKEKIYERLLDLRKTDFDFVVKEVSKVVDFTLPE